MRPLRRWPAAAGAAIALCGLSGCGATRVEVIRDVGKDPIPYGSYVTQLCQAIGPVEQDAQALGRALGDYATKAPGAQKKVLTLLRSEGRDSRHAVSLLHATGSPRVANGSLLAAEMRATLERIQRSDEAFAGELSGGHWTWPADSRAKRERLRPSFQALLLVARGIEHLPATRQGQEAMARSATCRELFGPVRLGGRID